MNGPDGVAGKTASSVRPLDPADRVAVMLWDADGVLQHPQFGWTDTLERIGGPGFAQRTFAAEIPALRGDVTFRQSLTQLVSEWPGARPDVDDLLGVWERVDLDTDATALVAEVVDSGVHCMLATNQQDHRKAFLRKRFGYDDMFTRSYYSCDMGAMKPEPAYFEHILKELAQDLGIDDPHRVGFVDDNVANVRAAQEAGIRAVLHDPATGVAGLRSDLGLTG